MAWKSRRVSNGATVLLSYLSCFTNFCHPTVRSPLTRWMMAVGPNEWNDGRLMGNLEVEQKFHCSNALVEKLASLASSLQSQRITDVYFDTSDFCMTKKDLWLRSRNGELELKSPHNFEHETSVNLYMEATKHHEIAAVLLQQANIDLPTHISPGDLENVGIQPFAKIKTFRSRYHIHLGEIHPMMKVDSKVAVFVDIDQVYFLQENELQMSLEADYVIGEVELDAETVTLLSTWEKVQVLQHAMKMLDINVASPRGKVDEFLQRHRPYHFEALQRAGILSKAAELMFCSIIALALTVNGVAGGEVLAPDIPPQVEVLVNGSRPEELFESEIHLGPLVQNESKLDSFGYAKHPKNTLDWRDLRSIIKGRKCSNEKADEQCGELVCRKGLCSYCTQDSECPSLHQCMANSNGGQTCHAMQRKAWESAWNDRSEKFCTFLILVSSALAAASGTGGGSIFVPVLISFSYLQESAVVALSQFMILVGSMVNLSVFMTRRHPDFPELPVIDYDCIVVLIPMLCLGVTLGVLVNRSAPSWLLLALLCSTLCLALWRTGSKGFKQLKKEQEQLCVRGPEEDVPEAGPEVVVSYADVLVELMEAKSEQIAGIAIVWLLMLAASLHGLPYCSAKYGVFVVCLAALLSTFAMVMTWRFQATSYLNPIDWLKGGEDRHPMTFPMVAFATGFLGAMLGLGGGILLSPVLIEVGMHSEAVQATVASFVFLSSSLATIQYFMMDQIVWHYALWYGMVAIAATFLGQTACEIFIRKRRRYSFITLSVASVLLLSLICLCVVGTKTVAHDYEMGKPLGFSFTRLCNSGRGSIIRPNVALGNGVAMLHTKP